jgi:hypothetical protein
LRHYNAQMFWWSGIVSLRFVCRRYLNPTRIDFRRYRCLGQ